MKPDIDTIVKDLLAAEPELTLEASALRALVAELTEHQPAVTVDAAFRARLRSELLEALPAPKVSRTRVQLPWWLIYTVPVGVTAILLLVVQPTPTTLPPTAPDSYESAPAMYEMEPGASKRSGEMSEESMSTGLADDTMSFPAPVGTNDFFTAAFTENRDAVRVAYVSVSAPAFIRVTGDTGEVLVSKLLPPGEQTNIELSLPSTVTVGVTYTATLHYDNGDGVFSAVDDMPALDTAGTPIAMTLVP
ncbi:MAG: DUF4115 domain-containing protein [Candidatus Pacebacteria bacterium]|jgi:hypothetical protein|nr:DUF4115 domain-containing protein [Candidatus Paceibacterota bacterium]